jgi:dTDP-4-amino-4,6-dideoxy-D-glucose/dTDP-4-amino-2,4-dideoxy-beta-L-xylose transaminase
MEIEPSGIIGDAPSGAAASIPLFKVAMSDHATTLVSQVLESGYIGQGPKVEEFQGLLAERLGNPHVVTVNSATSGLQLALHMVNRDRSEPAEVVTTPLTCTATNWPILAAGFRLRWADVDPATCNIDIADVARKITPATRAVMVVHWGGYPVDLEALGKVLDDAESEHGHRPVIIEDCAHAWGSTYQGLPLGNHGNPAVFSFQAIKHLTSGDGGAVVFPDAAAYERAKLLRWYGIDREGPRADFRCEADIPEWGFKFHMNDINAAIGIANLGVIDTVVGRHRANAAYYDAELATADGVETLERAPDRESAFWLYTMYVDRRDDFMRKMADSGIAVSRVHERNDMHSCVSEYTAELPQLEQTVARMICIPVGWWVTEDDRARIVDTIRSGW